MVRVTNAMGALLLVVVVVIASAWLLASRDSTAQAAPVAVSAVATRWVTNYEQDPFDRNQVRRSTVSVTEVAIVWSDGRTELRDLRK